MAAAFGWVTEKEKKGSERVLLATAGGGTGAVGHMAGAAVPFAVTE